MNKTKSYFSKEISNKMKLLASSIKNKEHTHLKEVKNENEKFKKMYSTNLFWIPIICQVHSHIGSEYITVNKTGKINFKNIQTSWRLHSNNRK